MMGSLSGQGPAITGLILNSDSLTFNSNKRGVHSLSRVSAPTAVCKCAYSFKVFRLETLVCVIT